MPPKSKFTETDEKALTWIYNYVKSLAGYEDAKNGRLYVYIEKESMISNQSASTMARWLKAEGLLHRGQMVIH